MIVMCGRLCKNVMYTIGPRLSTAMVIYGVYGEKGKMGISNEIADQNEILPLTKYATYLLMITTSTFTLKIY